MTTLADIRPMRAAIEVQLASSFHTRTLWSNQTLQTLSREQIQIRFDIYLQSFSENCVIILAA